MRPFVKIFLLLKILTIKDKIRYLDTTIIERIIQHKNTREDINYLWHFINFMRLSQSFIFFRIFKIY